MCSREPRFSSSVQDQYVGVMVCGVVTYKDEFESSLCLTPSPALCPRLSLVMAMSPWENLVGGYFVGVILGSMYVRLIVGVASPAKYLTTITAVARSLGLIFLVPASKASLGLSQSRHGRTTASIPRIP